jgi:hypothetical protein
MRSNNEAIETALVSAAEEPRHAKTVRAGAHRANVAPKRQVGEEGHLGQESAQNAQVGKEGRIGS